MIAPHPGHVFVLVVKEQHLRVRHARLAADARKVLGVLLSARVVKAGGRGDERGARKQVGDACSRARSVLARLAGGSAHAARRQLIMRQWRRLLCKWQKPCTRALYHLLKKACMAPRTARTQQHSRHKGATPATGPRTELVHECARDARRGRPRGDRHGHTARPAALLPTLNEHSPL